MEAEEIPSPLLLRTRSLKNNSGTENARFGKGWAETHAAPAQAVTDVSRGATPTLFVDAVCTCLTPAAMSLVHGMDGLATTAAARRRRICNTCGGSLPDERSAVDALVSRCSTPALTPGPSPPKTNGLVGGSSEHDEILACILVQQRAELNGLFVDWVERLDAVRAVHEQRQSEFIERALAACSAGFASNGPLLWPGARSPSPPPQLPGAPPLPSEGVQLLPIGILGTARPNSAVRRSPPKGPVLHESPPPPFSSVMPQSDEVSPLSPLNDPETPVALKAMMSLGIPGCVNGQDEVAEGGSPGQSMKDGVSEIGDLSRFVDDLEQGTLGGQTFSPSPDRGHADTEANLSQAKAPRALAEMDKGETPKEDEMEDKHEYDDFPGFYGLAQLQLRKLVRSHCFTAIASLAILLNAFYIGWMEERQLQSEILGDKARRRGGIMDTKDGISAHMENVFCFFFTIECLLRCTAQPASFLLGSDRWWNLFDLALIFNCLLEVILSDVGIPNLTIVRMMRICRLFKILRIIRVMRFFRTLRLMVSSIVASMVSLLWVFLLITFAMYVWSLLFLHATYEYAKEVNDGKTGATQELLDNLVAEFGTVLTSLVTLFMAVSGGRDWSEIFYPLRELHVSYGWIFIAYIFFIVFGMLNVVTSAFVDILQQVSRRDRDMVIEEEMKRTMVYIEGVKQIFEAADADHSKTLSWCELEAHMEDERMKAYLNSLELDASQARALFVLLDVDESGEICVEEFVKGCMRLKGSARSMDVNMLLYETEKILFQFADFKHKASAQLQFIMDMLENPSLKKKDLASTTKSGSSGRSAGLAQMGRSKSRLEASLDALQHIDDESEPDDAPQPAPSASAPQLARAAPGSIAT